MLFQIDPKVEAFGTTRSTNTPLIRDVQKKYMWGSETSMDHVYRRVAKAIAKSPAESINIQPPHGLLSHTNQVEEAFYEMMSKVLFWPGGRILAGAGTDKVVTLMNCYVNGTLEDSMSGIMHGVRSLAITSQQGGGMGTDFSPLRPLNALLTRTQSAASGPLPFMDVFNATGKTVRSAGERRAAQMGTLSDTHPDLPEYIRSKGEGLRDGSKRFAEFNISVLVSDAFKAAAEEDEDWLLYFHIPPIGVRSQDLIDRDFEDDDGVKQYVYSVWRAKELWDLIMQYTYEFSDPGVIFIDRINDLNNLGYCEEIRCTNPCGEQPLPPHGTCNLGAVNVANCVKNPFTDRAYIDFDLVAEVAKWGVRFLDNVIDVTGYPLDEQRQEEFAKRRIGLGLFGLGTAFACLGVRYGSQESVQLASKVMKTIALSAYEASMALATERGSFPLFKDIIIEHGFIRERLGDMHEDIVEKGLRNGVILTIAPTGTTAIAAGNFSSGLEPDFAHSYTRKVRSKNTEKFDSYQEESYTYRFYKFCTGKDDFLQHDYSAVAGNISVHEHIRVQAALQRWVDASVSKTANVPVDISYDEFVGIYDLAYAMGCKGCTTYRHSKWRDSILSESDAKESGSEKAPTIPMVVKRPGYLEGRTYKLDWVSLRASMYVTINYYQGRPYEIFFASKDAKYQDWMTGLTLMISKIMRTGIGVETIPDDLQQVVSTHDTSWEGGKHYGSLIARIAATIRQDFIEHGILEAPEGDIQYASLVVTPNQIIVKPTGIKCEQCNVEAVVIENGCEVCKNCGYSTCG